uniref:Uncharacterized protein n=1 Tax=Anguilla anguilla TaxID=7936 RepID=A0A0E9W080_ANGAN
MEESSRQFSCSLSTFSLGQRDTSADTAEIWFWLRLISMACSTATSAGTAWMRFLDRSRTSR